MFRKVKVRTDGMGDIREDIVMAKKMRWEVRTTTLARTHAQPARTSETSVVLFVGRLVQSRQRLFYLLHD